MNSSFKKIEKRSVCVAQLLIYPLLLAIRLLIVRNHIHRDIKGLASIKKDDGRTYILYANHQSKLDGIVICTAFPFRVIRELLPFRFFVYNAYMQGIMRYVLTILGGFPSHEDKKMLFGLDKARDVMSTNQTVVIFPAGKRTREKIAKRGVAVLSAEPNTYLIPVNIDWKDHFHCDIYIGKPIKGSIEHTPEQLMEYVYDLPKIMAKI